MTTHKKTALPLDEMSNRWGACAADIDQLRETFKDGTAVFSADNMEKFAGVDIIWGGRMVPQSAQIELAEAWYDRAMVGSTASWKDEVRGLLDVPDEALSSQHIQMRRAEAKEQGSDEDKAAAAVGYAMAQLANSYAKGLPSDHNQVCRSLKAIAKHAARRTALVENRSIESVTNDFKRDVLASLDENGIISAE